MSLPPKGNGPIERHLYQLQKMADTNNASEEMKKEIDRCLELVKAKEEYCDKITTQASPELGRLERDTISHPWSQLHEDGTFSRTLNPRMMSGNTEVQFLKSLISMSKAKRVLELGCFCGYGALGMAEALPADGLVITCEIHPYLQKLARKFIDTSPHGKKVTIKAGPAKDTMLDLAEKGEQFDLIFMDANKDGYIDYYKTIFSKGLLACNGTIVVDNAFGGGYTYSKEIERPVGPHVEKFNEMILKENDIQKVLLPFMDGVMIIRRKKEVDGQL